MKSEVNSPVPVERLADEYLRVQVGFHARGEAAWQAFQRTGESIPAEDVFRRLEEKLEAKRRSLGDSHFT